jgi:hypothetical protein
VCETAVATRKGGRRESQKALRASARLARYGFASVYARPSRAADPSPSCPASAHPLERRALARELDDARVRPVSARRLQTPLRAGAGGRKVGAWGRAADRVLCGACSAYSFRQRLMSHESRKERLFQAVLARISRGRLMRPAKCPTKCPTDMSPAGPLQLRVALRLFSTIEPSVSGSPAPFVCYSGDARQSIRAGASTVGSPTTPTPDRDTARTRRVSSSIGGAWLGVRGRGACVFRIRLQRPPTSAATS